MGKPLRALIVEDVEDDALLLLRELKRGGFDVTYDRVDSAETMTAALDTKRWDIVITDYAMPGFGAEAALALVQSRNLDLPVIIVSGTVNEEIAVDVIRAGAHDFMAKGNFARLIPAITRETRDASLRAERIEMQERLVISERMASLGMLAAGVAHEINNPLAVVMANLDFATHDMVAVITELRTRAERDGTTEDEKAELTRLIARLRDIEEPLRDARGSADRVRGIVRDLKIFSRSDEEKRGSVDVIRVLEGALRMAGNEVRHRAQLVKDLKPVPPIEGNEARLGQVFLNLIVNAAQSIPEGRADRNEIRLATFVDPHGKVTVEIKDTGAGMTEAVVGRIFEPFYTTKAVGVGMGLGLAICHRIVTSLGGTIVVTSEVGKGSTFRVTFEAAQTVPIPLSTVPPPVLGPRRGRVLVIDDEPVLAMAVKKMLARDHDVTVSNGARDALERIVGGARFDVMLCDLMMPEMTGMEFHAELGRVVPDEIAKIIFMTGGAFTEQAQEFLEVVTNPRVEKPFDVDHLKRLIADLLGD